jgi:hypothetical protein
VWMDGAIKIVSNLAARQNIVPSLMVQLLTEYYIVEVLQGVAIPFKGPNVHLIHRPTNGSSFGRTLRGFRNPDWPMNRLSTNLCHGIQSVYTEMRSFQHSVPYPGELLRAEVRPAKVIVRIYHLYNNFESSDAEDSTDAQYFAPQDISAHTWHNELNMLVAELVVKSDQNCPVDPDGLVKYGQRYEQIKCEDGSVLPIVSIKRTHMQPSGMEARLNKERPIPSAEIVWRRRRFS